MRYFKIGDFTDRAGRIWFNADKFDTIASEMVLTGEELTFSGTTLSDARSGDIEASLEALDAVFVAKSAEIEADFEPFEAVCSGTFVDSYNAIDVTFLEPHLEILSGQGIICTFEPLELTINEVINMADMELLFKEPELLITGENTFVYLALKAKEPELTMICGIAMGLEFEDPKISMSGSVGFVGGLACRMSPAEFHALGGAPPSLALKFDPLTFTAQGDTPSVASMTVTFERVQGLLAGAFPLSGDLNARFGLMSINMGGVNNPVGGLSVTFIPPRLTMDAGQHITADLDVTMALMKIRIGMLTDGPNDFNVEFPLPHIDMGSGGLGEDGADCDLADTLVYGG